MVGEHISEYSPEEQLQESVSLSQKRSDAVSKICIGLEKVCACEDYRLICLAFLSLPLAQPLRESILYNPPHLFFMIHSTDPSSPNLPTPLTLVPPPHALTRPVQPPRSVSAFSALAQLYTFYKTSSQGRTSQPTAPNSSHHSQPPTPQPSKHASSPAPESVTLSTCAPALTELTWRW